MATKKSSKFDIKITSPELLKAIRYASAKVAAQNVSSNGKVHGVIFAQVFVTEEPGEVRVKGDYIEPEYCDALQAVLNQRTRTYGR